MECLCGECVRGETGCICDTCKNEVRCENSYHCEAIYDDRINGVGIGGDEDFESEEEGK